MTIAALLMAAGTGQRFGAAQPKQYLPLLGRPVIRHAAEALLAEGLVDRLLPVVAAGEEARVAAILAALPALPPVAGGASRAASVRAGLEALAADPPAIVLVHDAARPVIPPGTLAALRDALAGAPGAIPAQPVTDTLKRGDGARILAPRPRRPSASTRCSPPTAPATAPPPTTPRCWKPPACRWRWCRAARTTSRSPGPRT
jgi:2-C-methyl-D-erythritol 4-phosphate cytidylyltransferase / 2-C-methyl-D-erythritol 2,4-cyclodiphosphate synthase